MNELLLLEIAATVLGLLFLILLIKENIWCWVFGGMSSFLSIILFYYSQLYAEAILYFYYVIIAVYGYFIWSRSRQKGKSLPITDISLIKSLLFVLIGGIVGLLLGIILERNTDADLPYVDAQTTIFSFLASYLEAHKILSGWIFWIIINAITIGMYSFKGLYFYAGLMVVYFSLSVFGYFQWKKQRISPIS